jgi:glucose/arabinose dehydrogenase
MPNAQMIAAQSVRWWCAQSFDLKSSPPKLASVEKLWVQEPKVTGKGHYSHRIAFGPDGKMFITSGDRQKLTPAQDFDGNLGKVLRLNDDGTVPDDNPWQNRVRLPGNSGPSVTATCWASLLMPTDVCGSTRWGRVTAMS